MEPRPCLEILEGELAGARYVLMADRLVIGRSAECDICLEQVSGVSRRHAELTLAPDGGASLRDLGSSNGTFVDGERIVVAAIAPGQAFRVGSLGMRLLGPEAPSSPEPLAPVPAPGAIEPAPPGRDQVVLRPAPPDGPPDGLYPGAWRGAGGAEAKNALAGIAAAVAVLVAAAYAAGALVGGRSPQADYPRLLAVGQRKLVPTARPFEDFVLEPYEGGPAPVAIAEFDGLLSEAIRETNAAHAQLGRPALQLRFLVAEGLAPTGGQPAWIALSGPRGTDRIPVVVRGAAAPEGRQPPVQDIPRLDRAVTLAQGLRKAAWLERDGHLYFALQEYGRAAALAQSMGNEGLRAQARCLELRHRAHLRLKDQLSGRFRAALLEAFPSAGARRPPAYGAAWQGLAEAKRLIPDESDLDWQVLDYWQAWIRRLHSERRR